MGWGQERDSLRSWRGRLRSVVDVYRAKANCFLWQQQGRSGGNFGGNSHSTRTRSQASMRISERNSVVAAPPYFFQAPEGIFPALLSSGPWNQGWNVSRSVARPRSPAIRGGWRWDLRLTCAVSDCSTRQHSVTSWPTRCASSRERFKGPPSGGIRTLVRPARKAYTSARHGASTRTKNRCSNPFGMHATLTADGRPSQSLSSARQSSVPILPFSLRVPISLPPELPGTAPPPRGRTASASALAERPA